MGLFDIIELENHVQAIGEYMLYLDANPDELRSVGFYVSDHLKKMLKVLEKFKNFS